MSRILSKTSPLCLKPHFFSKHPLSITRPFSVSRGNKDDHPDTPNKPNLNEHITRFFKKQALFHLNMKAEETSHFKYIGYNNAIRVLENLQKKVESKKDVEKLRLIGNPLARSVHQIIKTGRMISSEDDQWEAVTDLTRVTGITYNNARTLCNKKIKSIEDLRKNTQYLTEEQKKALQLLEYLEMEISKEEVQKIEQFLRTTLCNAVDNKLTIEAVYRRNAPIVGIDFLITHPDFEILKRRDKDSKGPRDDFLVTIVDTLTKSRIIKEDFAPTEKYKFVGMVQPFEKGLARLTRFHVVDKDEYFYARLSLTETPQTWRMMKEKALQIGYIIKQYGVSLPKELGGQRILVANEEEIFKLLQWEEFCPPSHIPEFVSKANSSARVEPVE